MSLTQAMDKLPAWDHYVGGLFEKIGWGIDLTMLLLAVFIVWLVFAWRNKPEYKALFLAYLLMP